MDPKNQILHAATGLFAKKGYAATTIREISGVAGVNLAMVNYYFKSKDQLLATMMQAGINSVIEIMKQLIKEDKSGLEKLDFIIDLHAEYIFSNKEIAIIFFQEQMASSDAGTRQIVQELDQWNRKVFEQILLSGREECIFSKSSNASLLYATLLGTIQQVVVQSISKEPKNAEEEISLFKYNKEELVSYLKTLCRKILLRDD